MVRDTLSRGADRRRVLLVATKVPGNGCETRHASPAIVSDRIRTMEIAWTRSATKHRISRTRSGYVARTATTILRQPAPTDSQATDDRLVFLGADESGTLLEVMAVETDAGGLLVIHAMPMRTKYKPHLKGDDDA